MSTVKTNQIQTTGGKVILPSTGSILQVAYDESTTQVTSSGTTYAVIHSVTLTSVATNSRYFLTGYCHGYSGTSGRRANLGFSVTINGTTTRIYGVDSTDNWGTPAYPGGQYNRSGVYTSTAAAGTSLTFNLLAGGYDGAVSFNYSGYSHKSTITVMEISA
jgi:hypothetical protein